MIGQIISLKTDPADPAASDKGIDFMHHGSVIWTENDILLWISALHFRIISAIDKHFHLILTAQDIAS